MVNTEERVIVKCPCGCGNKVPLLTGTITLGESNPFYRAYLMNDGKGPNLWLMLHTGSWTDDPRDCGILIHSLKENDGIRSFLSEQKDSPWRDMNLEELRFLTRDEVLSQEGGKEWVFDIHDHFVDMESEVKEFMGKNA